MHVFMDVFVCVCVCVCGGGVTAVRVCVRGGGCTCVLCFAVAHRTIISVSLIVVVLFHKGRGDSGWQSNLHQQTDALAPS